MKKLAFTVFAILCWSLSLSAAITRVQSATGNTGSSAATSFTVTLGAAPTNGNILIAAVCTTQNNGPTYIASTTDITWFGNVNSTTGTDVQLFIGYVRTGSASATVTITVFASTSGAAVVAEYSGFTRAVADRSVVGSGSSTSPNSGASPSTRSSNELWVAAIGQRSQNPATFSSPGGSFSIVAQTGSTINTSNSDRSVALLEQIASSTGTPTASCTTSQSNAWISYLVTFDEASTGGGQVNSID